MEQGTRKLMTMHKSLHPRDNIDVSRKERGTIQDHPNYNIVTISQNTEKSSGDLRRLAVTQTPVKDHQLMLV